MKKCLSILCLILIYCPLLLSQKRSDANIVGHVTSNSDHIPFATISIKGTTYGINTDESGHYMLVNLPPGTHMLQATAIGFKPVETQITIASGETKEINFSLEEDVFGLEEVVITADRSEIKRVEAVTIVNTLSPKMFSSSQSVTLMEGLNFAPGLRIENNCQNCGFSQVRMNGMEGPYSQILINSRPIFSGLAGVYGLELIPANMIERVEVIRGGGSALYGSNAIAGIVNIILSEPMNNAYEAGINTGLTGVGMEGTGGVALDNSVDLNISVNSSDAKTGMSLFGFTRERQMFDANGDDFSEISPMNNTTIGCTLYHKFGTRNKISLDFFNIKEERDGGNKHDYPIHERDMSETVRHNITTGAFTFEQYFRDYDLLSLYFSLQNLVRNSYYGANQSLKDYGLSKDLTYNTGIQYKLYLGNSSLIAGLEKTGSTLRDKKQGYPDYDNAVIINDSIISVPHTENILVSDQSSSIYGGYLQYDLKLNKLKLGLGGRLDRYRIIDNAKSEEASEGNVFSPRISLMYELFPCLRARVSYSQGFRAPQIFNEDLHIETSGARQVIHVNDPGLEQETSHSFMASVDFNKLIGAVNTGLLIEGFYTILRDPFVNEIGEPDENGRVLYTRRNAEDGAVVRGVNMEFKLKPLTNFSLISGFTFQSSKYDIAQQFNKREFFRTPADYGYVNLDWDLTKKLRFSSTFTYTGRMYVPYFGPMIPDPDQGILKKSDPFFDMGGKLNYDIKLNGCSVRFFAGIKNIFNSYQTDFDMGIDRDPSYIYGPISPRTIYFGIKIGNKL